MKITDNRLSSISEVQIFFIFCKVAIVDDDIFLEILSSKKNLTSNILRNFTHCSTQHPESHFQEKTPFTVFYFTTIPLLPFVSLLTRTV